jgi:SecD/SecF fusion protein
VLTVKDPYDVTGDYLTSATPGLDERGGHCVMFAFNAEGALRFSQFTGENIPDSARQTNELGIILDGYLQSAPSIQSTISDRGQITGDFTESDVKDLSEILSAGALPAALDRNPVSETLTSPTLGQDTIDAAVRAMTVAVVIVVVFMLIYYRFAGLVANIALLLNVLLTVAFMVMFNAAFTLAGLAGLALTVGMAVDANVLIYERMREELSRGATLRMAIRNGFDRASVTIIDANVTTLITAIVLYIIGTDQVKGFAVALTVGLSWNLFTAITVSRLIFEVAERNRLVSNLKFMQILGATNFDFIGKRYFCYALSIVVLGIGLVAAVQRGSDLFNIDFTGGVSITTVFEKAPEGGIAEVRKRVEKVLPEATVQQLAEMPGYPQGAGFKIVTSDLDREHVEDQLKHEFGAQLAYHHMTPGKLEPIGAAAATPGDAGPALTPAVNDNSLNEASSDDKEAASACDQEPETPATPTATASPTATATGTGAKPQATSPAPAATPTATATTTPTTTTPATNTTPAEEAEAGSGSFAGGSLVTLTFQPAIAYDKLEEHVRAVLQPDKDATGTAFELTAQGYEPGSSQRLPSWDLKIAAPPAEAETALTKISARLADAPFFPSSENVGAAVAGGARQSAVTAMIISLAMVLAYIWFRFQNLSFGIAAIVALVHDVMFTVGCLAVSKWLAGPLGFALVDPFKIDLTIIAAILTIIGFSLNDTIVIFDRIREVKGKSTNITADLINLCVNQTLSRTILTSLTVFMVVVVLYIWGGPGIHGFAFALVVGTLSGTYSTIYVASPVLLWLHQRSKARAAAPQAATQAS